MSRSNAPGPRGILQRGTAAPKAGHKRILAAPELRAFIEHYWIVRWDLRGQAPQLAETLPHPSVYWLTERRTSRVHGVPTGRFTRHLKGRGRVFGVKFRPGGFYPFFQSPVARLTDKSLSLVKVFGPDARDLQPRLTAFSVQALRDDDEIDDTMMDAVDRFLLERLPSPDPQLAVVTEIVGTIVKTTAITKVDQLVALFGLNKRALQRLFSQYVGVSPKWMIKRYRLHEAVERVAAGHKINWSRLALDLGYFDQTHFIKEFKSYIGRSPAEYAKGV